MTEALCLLPPARQEPMEIMVIGTESLGVRGGLSCMVTVGSRQGGLMSIGI
ncbi:hypothetical protein [Methanogenium cariaci]|uniref:hypothetical protein n=1 Tax=Methanogenium cariaci TaxID=2197 RepID=UPI0012F6D0F4|nr:hypothetical protein [Methanogenium cariaci]